MGTSRPGEARRLCGPDVAVCTNYADLLDRSDLDAVVVCVPTHLHESFVAEALIRGLPTLCEKPLSSIWLRRNECPTPPGANKPA